MIHRQNHLNNYIILFYFILEAKTGNLIQWSVYIFIISFHSERSSSNSIQSVKQMSFLFFIFRYSLHISLHFLLLGIFSIHFFILYICSIARCMEIPKHRWFSFVQVRNVYQLFLTFSFSTRGERHNFHCADCFYLVLPSTPQLNWPAQSPKSQLTDPTNARSFRRPQLDWPR